MVKLVEENQKEPHGECAVVNSEISTEIDIETE